ncbi:MAG: hypothetical protein FWE24_09090 [Defluviitaleaceae bacterium]|nr:hypothetical protein [Defluviitaleaceae bacterium]
MGRYICCFCDESIEENVTALMVETNWSDNNEDNKEFQQLFCHFDCLKGMLCKSEYLYISEG